MRPALTAKIGEDRVREVDVGVVALDHAGGIPDGESGIEGLDELGVGVHLSLLTQS